MNFELPPEQTGAAAWYGPEIAKRTDWQMPLSGAEVAEIEAATRAPVARDADIAVLKPQDFPLPTLGPKLRSRVDDEVLNGRGFLLLRGLPVERWSIDPHSTGVYIADHRAPLITIQIQFPVGREMDATREAGIREAWLLQANEPDGRLEAREARLGDQLRLSVYHDTATLEILCLAEDLPEVRALLTDILSNRAYAQDDIQSLRIDKAKEWYQNHQNPYR